MSVHGNLKLTGRLVHPSDKRVKESIEEVNMKICVGTEKEKSVCNFLLA